MSRTTGYVVVASDTAGGTATMGVSPVMRSKEEAWAWLRERPSYGAPAGYDERPHVVPHGSGELRWQVCATSCDDSAIECCEAVRGILLDETRTPEGRCGRALRLIAESEERWLPPRKWAVDVVFSPATCVHGVVARSAAEAERKVSGMLDSGAFALSDARKAEIIDMLLENVETVKAAGEESGHE